MLSTLTFDPKGHDGLGVDLNKLLTHKLAVQGNSGSGKSWLVRTLLEGTHGAVQHLVLDPEGEFKTLRERFDDYVILAASGGDLDITAETTGAPVQALVKAGANIVLDLSDFTLGERDAVCAAAIRTLMSLPRGDWRHLLIVVDEAHTLAPEGSGSGASLAALIDLATRGRKRGFGLVAVTQRIALLNKSLLAMCSNRIIGLTTLGTDMKRAGEELGFNTRERGALKSLAVGEFFAVGPAISHEVVKVKSGPVESTHPEPGQLTSAPPPASAALAKIIRGLQTLKVDDAPVEAEDWVSAKIGIGEDEVRRRVAQAVAEATAPLHAKIEELTAFCRRYVGEVESLLGVPESSVQDTVSDAIPEVGETTESVPVKPTKSETPLATGLPKAQYRILGALAGTAPLGVTALERNTAAVLSGQSPRSSAYAAHVASLNTAGLICYPQEGFVGLTNAGRKLVPVPGQPTTLAELHQRWQGYLKSYEVALLTPLLECYPWPLSREQLGELSERSPTSSAFSDALASLKSLGLVEYPAKGRVKATDLLFPRQLTQTETTH